MRQGLQLGFFFSRRIPPDEPLSFLTVLMKVSSAVTYLDQMKLPFATAVAGHASSSGFLEVLVSMTRTSTSSRADCVGIWRWKVKYLLEI